MLKAKEASELTMMKSDGINEALVQLEKDINEAIEYGRNFVSIDYIISYKDIDYLVDLGYEVRRYKNGLRSMTEVIW